MPLLSPGLIAKREVSAGDVLETCDCAGGAGQSRHQRHRAQAVRKSAQGRGGRRAARAAGRRAVSAQGPRLPRDGRAGAARQQPVQGFRGRSRQRLCRALQEGGAGHLRPDLDAGVRPQPQHRAAPQRIVPQSVEPRIFGRRLIGRCRGSGHCRCSSRGACDRRRRLDPYSSGAVRPVRTEALARTRVVRARLGRGMGRAVGGARREPQRARFGVDARLHGRYRARRSLCGAHARAIVRGGARPLSRQAQDCADAEGSSRRKVASRDREGRAGRGQVVREPRAHRRGGGSQARPGGAAAHERQDRGGQHRALLHNALEGAGTRAGCEGCGGGYVGRLPARPEGQPRSSTSRPSRRCMRPAAGWRRFSPATT